MILAALALSACATTQEAAAPREDVSGIQCGKLAEVLDANGGSDPLFIGERPTGQVVVLYHPESEDWSVVTIDEENGTCVRASGQGAWIGTVRAGVNA